MMSEKTMWAVYCRQFVERLTPLAARDGLVGQLNILWIFLPEGDEKKHAGVTGCYRKIDGEPQILLPAYLWGDLQALNPDAEQLDSEKSQDLARTLAHEVKHWLDEQQHPRYWRFWNRLRIRVQVMSSRQPWFWGDLYGLVYVLSPLERRANRYAAERWRDYYHALYGIWPG